MKSTYTQIPSEPIPVASAVTLVEVVSPSDLEAGYTFMAIYEATTFQITVPEGGVTKGQKFSVPFSSSATISANQSTNNEDEDEAVHGKWKDGLFSCLKYGLCHPTFGHCLFCPQLLTGQVMTRMHLNWKAEEDTEEESKLTYRNVCIIVGIYWIMRLLVGPDDNEAASPISAALINSPLLILSSQLFSFFFFIYTLLIITRTRKAIRQKYDIPESHCHGCEDFCCAFWCANCTSAQMARQTADYDVERAQCCTNTGLSPTYHVMIV